MIKERRERGIEKSEDKMCSGQQDNEMARTASEDERPQKQRRKRRKDGRR